MALALLVGVGVAELLYRTAAVHDLAGRWSGRGRLVAMGDGKGIYEKDLGGHERTADELIRLRNLERLSAHEAVEPGAVDRELALLEAQFGSSKVFRASLDQDRLSVSDLRERITNHLRAVAWLERRVRPDTVPAESECRRFYNAHPGFFTQPAHFRVSHILLAAHAATPPDIVEQKQLGIAALASRLARGESLARFAAETSEDEASKTRGGDLGFFSDARMPADFMAEIKRLRPGQTSKPFRSHLGFHIAQLTEIRSPRLLTFEEARPEISLALSNERRANATAQLASSLAFPTDTPVQR
jgi:parvulin-like peptidyl-prolyl isomerase